MATFNYLVNVGGNFKPYESALKNAIKTTRLEFSKAKEEWENVTIKTSSKDNFISDLKSLYEITKEFSSGIPIKFDPASKKTLQKKLDEVSDLNIAINEKSVDKAKRLLSSKFDEIFNLYSDFVPLPNKKDYKNNEEYKVAKANYDSITASRNEKVLPILKDIIDYNRTLLDYGVIDEKVFAKVLGNVKNKNEDVINDLLMQAQKNKIDLAGGVNLDKLFQDGDSTLNGLSNFIKVLNRFAGLDETMKKADESKFAEYSKQRVNQIRENLINKQKAESALSDIDPSTTNKINSSLTEASDSVDKITNSVKELNAIPIKIDDESINEFYEKINKLSAEPTIIKASVDPEAKEQLENLLKIKEDLKASGTIKLKLSTSTINSVNDLRDKVDSLKYDVISSMSQPLELKGDVSEQFKTSINELKDTLDSITNKSRTIRFKISEATNRDITELNERLNSLSQKLIAESKEVSNVLETTAKQSEVSISNIPTVKINVNADSIDELAYKIISLEELLNSVVTVKGKVDESIYTELETLKAKLNDIEEKQRLINFKLNDNIDSQITELKDRLDKLVTDRVLDGNFKIDASVVSALSDNGDIVNNLQKIDETLNNVIDTMKALNSISDNVQENILSMGVDAINQMSSALDRLISRINVLLGYEVAPEEVDKVRKMLSNAQKSRKLNAEQRKPLKASNAKLNALSHAEEVDHNALRQALDEAYSLLGINPNVEKIKEVPVYVERTAKATKRATETTKEYAEQQEVFNNALKSYTKYASNVAKMSKEPTFDMNNAIKAKASIDELINSISKVDEELANSFKNKVETSNQKIYDDFVRNALDKISKQENKVNKNNGLLNNANIVNSIRTLRERLENITSETIEPTFMVQMYEDINKLSSDINSVLSNDNKLINDYTSTLKTYKNRAKLIIKMNGDNSNVVNQLESTEKILDNIKSSLNDSYLPDLDVAKTNANMEIYESFLEQREKVISSLKKLRDNDLYKGDKNIINGFIDELNSFKSIDDLDFSKINSISISIKKLMDSISDKSNKPGNLTKLEQIIASLSEFYNAPKYSGLPKDLKSDIENTLSRALKYKEKGLFSVEDIAKLNNELIGYKGQIKSLGKTMSLTSNVAFKLSEMNARLIAQYLSLYDIIRYARMFLNVIVEIDTAVGELRKVSNETDERLAASLKTSTKTAKELGASISDIVNATSDWSRLGYGIDEAEQLAKVSQLYVNVGDGIDMDSANESLISTLQGFQLPVDQAESIIDKFNEVANNYAIDTAGIGEALQRSAASFYAANTDLSKSIALVTTANTVLQNPDTVGTTFKTNLCLCV